MNSVLATMTMVLIVAIFLTGCLTVEKKSYKITMTGEQSGKCTITYYNIVSTKDDGKDISFKDYAELVTDYLEGTKLEDELVGCRNVTKRLYTQGDKLCGEISFDFDSLSTVRMYRYNAAAPLMMYVSGLSNETYATSNGTWGGERMPVVFWAANAKELTLQNTVTEIDTGHVGLAPQYEQWKHMKR
ncbi:MAG: hypothetical protein J0I17_07900 ['Candidatus Kapabacteria' thiocyanatum]|uniref:Uncharacterized protein n=1 Tax=Candidatus Kapaibacterium thiocyanatum TaxID=1895771 RepID=A0A1M3L265_9BACT|nr:hypothetical protein ['Candidatus Kapabacteria' thiocyanatum]OJX59305.1 MAG: hypothetical protein BGO89_02490 ['Candidatus Kapabacteria' thiocyanatum]